MAIPGPDLLAELRCAWSRRFEEPIELPVGRKLKTLAEAMAWLAKEVPKSEHKMEKNPGRGALRHASRGTRRPVDLRSDGNAAGGPPAP